MNVFTFIAGGPSVFITLTMNPKCVEVTDRLLSGQTAFDRPDIVTQVSKKYT
jgi:hypothetical protein